MDQTWGSAQVLYQSECTVGFTAHAYNSYTSTWKKIFATSAHCMNDGGNGTVTNTKLYQCCASAPADSIGREFWQSRILTNATHAYCPVNEECKATETALAEFSTGATWGKWQWGVQGGRNRSQSNLIVDDSIPVVDFNLGTGIVGDTINKVGYASGWTYGDVTEIGVTLLVGDYKLIGYDKADAGSLGGDSGSGVFFWEDGEAILMGQLWGGDDPGDVLFYFPFNNFHWDFDGPPGGDDWTVYYAPCPGTCPS